MKPPHGLQLNKSYRHLLSGWVVMINSFQEDGTITASVDFAYETADTIKRFQSSGLDRQRSGIRPEDLQEVGPPPPFDVY